MPERRDCGLTQGQPIFASIDLAEARAFLLLVPHAARYHAKAALGVVWSVDDGRSRLARQDGFTAVLADHFRLNTVRRS